MLGIISNRNLLIGLVLVIVMSPTLRSDLNASEKEEVVTFADDIKPILQKYCLKCHGNDDQNADLNLQNYATLLQGGSAGAVVKAGQSSASVLMLAITNEDDAARMPPESPRLPEEVITLISKWIDTGLRETSSSKALLAKSTLTFAPSASANGKPDGPPAMPVDLPDVAFGPTARPMSILGLAASPWAPLAAASGYKQVRLFNTDTEEEFGHLLFEPGVPHVLKFSQNGEILMAAGGHPGHSGSVVLYDVKTGDVVGRFGDELDTVLAADISPDQKLVAFGGPGRTVKAYSTESGKEVYRIERHTDWVTSVAFSPDGKQIATSDRAGNLYLSSADSGGILLSLESHKGSVRGLSWRSDSKVLASAGDDGRLIWWNAETGFVAMQNTNGHAPPRPEGFSGKLQSGVLSVRFCKDGGLISSGRDNRIKVWKTSSNQTNSLILEEGIPIQATVDYSGKKVIIGDTLGNIKIWSHN
ncbi:MAG: hypothetical protein CMM06_04410 [Rhodopirellula sp.]|nr:hypothetical protein [Rhodopirellula sp.]|tara:strand:+ start:23324 stop:24742 length:1419 start_codon:yes stop_codon:yes gene_type:complete